MAGDHDEVITPGEGILCRIDMGSGTTSRGLYLAAAGRLPQCYLPRRGAVVSDGQRLRQGPLADQGPRITQGRS